MLLQGKAWTSPQGAVDRYGDLYNYYSTALTQAGWSHVVDVPGVEIAGMDSSGFHGAAYGYVKTENGYLRSITLDGYFGDTSGSYNMFVSDIVQVASVVPGYKLNCMANATSTIP